jgi:hypothetical protein
VGCVESSLDHPSNPDRRLMSSNVARVASNNISPPTSKSNLPETGQAGARVGSHSAMLSGGILPVQDPGRHPAASNIAPSSVTRASTMSPLRFSVIRCPI